MLTIVSSGSNFWKQRWRSLCFWKFSLKNSKFRSLSKSQHLPFVLKSLETRIKTMKIFLMGKLKKKRPTFTVRLTFPLKEYLGIWNRFLEEVSRHLPFVYFFLGIMLRTKYSQKWKIEEKEADIYRSSNFSFKRSTLRNIFRILKESKPTFTVRLLFLNKIRL